jgi:hypothetical protein
LNEITNTHKWYSDSFIDSFSYLCYHWAHTEGLNNSIQYTTCKVPVEKRVSADQVQLLDNSVTRLVSVFYLEHHFVTAVIDYMSSTCTIYDGLRYNQVKWMEHLENIL